MIYPILHSSYYKSRNIYSISAATQANPCQITTSTVHTFLEKDQVTITNVNGMSQLNNNT